MTRNLGVIDAMLRILLGAGLIGVALYQPGTGYDWLGWVGVVPLLSGLLSWCPLYSILGIRTCGSA